MRSAGSAMERAWSSRFGAGDLIAPGIAVTDHLNGGSRQVGDPDAFHTPGFGDTFRSEGNDPPRFLGRAALDLLKVQVRVQRELFPHIHPAGLARRLHSKSLGLRIHVN